MPNARELLKKAYQLRMDVLTTYENCGTGHISSSFSCAEILTTLFYGGIMRFNPADPVWPERDRFLLSKGHAATIFYNLLADLGYFPKEELLRFGKKDGKMSVHLQYTVPGSEFSSGSLGAGLGVGAGMALAARQNRENHLVFVLTGDGECYEGSVWESAMFAAHNRLNNLIVIVDHNHMCCTDFIENCISQEPLQDKFAAFGFDAVCVDGHDPASLLRVLSGLRSRKSIKPLAIIADTVKAKGLPHVENTALCHGYAPKAEAMALAKAALSGWEERCQ